MTEYRSFYGKHALRHPPLPAFHRGSHATTRADTPLPQTSIVYRVAFITSPPISHRTTVSQFERSVSLVFHLSLVALSSTLSFSLPQPPPLSERPYSRAGNAMATFDAILPPFDLASSTILITGGRSDRRGTHGRTAVALQCSAHERACPCRAGVVLALGSA